MEGCLVEQEVMDGLSGFSAGILLDGMVDCGRAMVALLYGFVVAGLLFCSCVGLCSSDGTAGGTTGVTPAASSQDG